MKNFLKQTKVFRDLSKPQPKLPTLTWAWLISMFILFSCASNSQSEGGGQFSNISAEEAKALIVANQENDQFVILDTRSPSEYKKGHLVESVFYNYNASDYWEQIKKLDRDKVYLVYCHSGGRSGKTLNFMKKNGFKQAYNLSGGIVAWKRAGNAVVVD